MKNEAGTEIDDGENQNADVEHGNVRENLENVDDEDDDVKIMRLRLMEVLHTITPTIKVNIEKRERLTTIKKEI